MEQNTKPRNKPCPIVNPSMTKETRLHSVGKTVSSTNGAEKPEHLHTKKKKEEEEEIRSFFNTTHKNKLKMD